MRYFAFAIISIGALFVFSSCGGGVNEPAPNVNSPTTTEDQVASDDDDGTDTGEETPKKDPNKWRNIKGDIPADWHKLAKPGRNELYNAGIINEVESDTGFVAGIVTPEAPGPTEGDVEWDEWREHVSAAMLFHISNEKLDLVKAIQDAGPKYIDDFDKTTVTDDGDMAGGASPNMRYIYMALSNDNGTYVIVAVLNEGESHDANGRAVIEWAESIQPE